MSTVNWKALLSPTVVKNSNEGNQNLFVYPQFPFGITEYQDIPVRNPNGYTLFNMLVRMLRYGGYLPDRPSSHITQYEVRDALLFPRFNKISEETTVRIEYETEEYGDVKDIPITTDRILLTRPNENTPYYITEKSWHGGKLLEDYPYPVAKIKREMTAGITMDYGECELSFKMRSSYGKKLAKFWDIMTNLPPEKWDSTLYAYALGYVVGKQTYSNDAEEHRITTLIGELNLRLGFDVRKGEEVYGYGLPSQEMVFSINKEISTVKMAETNAIHRPSPPEHNSTVSVNYDNNVRFMSFLHASPYAEPATYKELRMRDMQL